ncbi:MAG: hypothetical protein IJC43_02630, partial [Clostridia bacterium]|nr:hypothetical protein [Clostridia bacterium]
AAAKFEQPMTPDAFARAALLQAKQEGAAFLASALADTRESGAAAVPAAPPPAHAAEDAVLAALHRMGREQRGERR